MVWEVWQDRGYCALGDSISAYVDFTPTPCGAVRCIGPFSAESPGLERMQSAMRSLTNLLESSFLPSNQFVLWGAYNDFPQYQEHEVAVLGTVCGYIPAPWLRTELLGYDEDSLAREWIATTDKVVHRSGLQFPDIDLSVPDPMLFHPSNAEESIKKLIDYSKTIAIVSQVNIPKTKFTPPHIRWSFSDKRKRNFTTESR